MIRRFSGSVCIGGFERDTEQLKRRGAEETAITQWHLHYYGLVPPKLATTYASLDLTANSVLPASLHSTRQGPFLSQSLYFFTKNPLLGFLKFPPLGSLGPLPPPAIHVSFTCLAVTDAFGASTGLTRPSATL
jgi:hypothetical protein